MVVKNFNYCWQSRVKRSSAVIRLGLLRDAHNLNQLEQGKQAMENTEKEVAGVSPKGEEEREGN